MYAVIDRFEEDWAVLYLDDDDTIINLPRCLLSPELNEGDYVKISIEYDKAKTEEAMAEAQALYEE